MGCILLRKCHLNTCSVGIATQDKELRKQFKGQPEHVVNFFKFVAEEIREIMAELGVRKFNELIGRVDMLETRDTIEHWKAKGLDLTSILHKSDVPEGTAIYHVSGQDHGLEKALDNKLARLPKDLYIGTQVGLEVYEFPNRESILRRAINFFRNS
jgi:glutamate synthase (NADPH/NADH) large chain